MLHRADAHLTHAAFTEITSQKPDTGDLHRIQRYRSARQHLEVMQR